MARGWFIGIELGLGPLDLYSISARAARFNRAMTLSKLRTYTCVLANQVSTQSGSVNWLIHRSVRYWLVSLMFKAAVPPAR